MAKITLSNVTNIDAVSVINANFNKIVQELQDKVLYRDNIPGEPNSVQNDIDFNGNDLLNVGNVVSVNGRWATIDELEVIRDQVDADRLTVATDKSLTLSYRNEAQTAATSAQTAYDNFDDRYLGVKSSDPGVDNDGNTLVSGALYFRSSGAPLMRVYNGTTWQDVGSITTTTTNLIDPTLYPNTTEAEQGINNTKVMTPLRTKEAINKQVKEGFTSTGPIVLPGNATSALQAVPKQQIDDLRIPVGTILPIFDNYPDTVNPVGGWIPCEGQWLDPLEYPDLFNLIGHKYGTLFGLFKNIDIRGLFIRGLNTSGVGSDVGRTHGSTQSASIESHTHVVNLQQLNSNSQNGWGRLATGGEGAEGTIPNINTEATGGTETRPANMALRYYIKT